MGGVLLSEEALGGDGGRAYLAVGDVLLTGLRVLDKNRREKLSGFQLGTCGGMTGGEKEAAPAPRQSIDGARLAVRLVIGA